MTVLVTGASGFVGCHALRALNRKGIRPVVIGRRRPPGLAECDFIEVDLLSDVDLRGLTDTVQARRLLHMAWYAEHGKYWHSPQNLRWVDATVRLVEAFCLSGGKQVVVSGTCAEYDWSYGFCREDVTPLVPSTLYGVAKDATRRLLMAICSQFQTKCAWARIFFPFGQGEPASRLIPSLIEALRGNVPPFPVGLNAYRDFLHVSYIADALVVLLEQNADGAYNVCSGEPVQISQIVRELARLLRADPQHIFDVSRERSGESSMLVGDKAKIEGLGWRPTASLSEGLESALREA